MIITEEKSDCFVTGFFCDLTLADCTAEQLESELKHLQFVIEVHCADMKGWIWDRFFFPTSITNNNRVIIMRVEPLLRIEKNLIESMGSAGAAIMLREGQVFAEVTFLQYKKMLPYADKERLIQSSVDGLRATGWGLVDFKQLAAGFEVTVKDPPLLKDPTYRENRFFFGVASRILELVYDVSLNIVESSYDEESNTLSFKLSLQESDRVVIPAVR